MSFLSKKKIPCLFVNIGGILEKLLNGSKMSKIYRPILYNTLENKRSITSVIQKNRLVKYKHFLYFLWH